MENRFRVHVFDPVSGSEVVKSLLPSEIWKLKRNNEDVEFVDLEDCDKFYELSGM